MKHTPGPWAFARYSKKRFGVGQHGSGAFFLLHCVDDDTENPQSWANARLIAAAPDLLEVLKEIVQLWDHHCYAHGDGQPSVLHAKASAAIAKAEGLE